MKTKLLNTISRQEALARVDLSLLPERRATDALACSKITALYPVYVPLEQGEAAAAGNRASISIISSMPKYNRAKVTLTIGKGLYDKAVEAALIGLKVGEQGQAVVKEETVVFTVLTLEKIIFPDPTDDMVAGMCIDGITTVWQYKDHLFASMQQEAIKNMGDQLIEQLLSDAQFDMDEGDIDTAVRMQYSLLRDRFLPQGLDLDTVPDEEWVKMFYQPKQQAAYKLIYPWFWKVCVTQSRQEYLTALRPYAIRGIQLFLVLCALLENQIPTLTIRC